MAVDTCVGGWDTEAIGVDKYGPIDEKSIPTWGHPLEASAYFAGVEKDQYQRTVTHPFSVLDNQAGPSALSYRTYETGQYLHAVHSEARDRIAQGADYGVHDSGDVADWRKINRSILPEHVRFARDIREHFISVLTMWKMQDKELSPWQQSLFELISRPNQQEFKQREIGMLSKMVQTYEVDTETARCVNIWGSTDNSNTCPNFYKERCTVVGSFYRLGKGGISLFGLTEEDNLLVELVLVKSPVNEFFIDTLKKQGYTGFKFSAIDCKPYDHIGGKKWIRVYSPRIEVA